MGHQLRRNLPSQQLIQPAPDIDGGEFSKFRWRISLKFPPLTIQVRRLGVGLRTDRHIFPCGHRHRPGHQTRNTCHHQTASRSIGRGNTNQQARGRDDPVISAQHRRPQPANPAGSMPLLVNHDDLAVKRMLTQPIPTVKNSMPPRTRTRVQTCPDRLQGHADSDLTELNQRRGSTTRKTRSPPINSKQTNKRNTPPPSTPTKPSPHPAAATPTTPAPTPPHPPAPAQSQNQATSCKAPHQRACSPSP